jgi:hypothetical protein
MITMKPTKRSPATLWEKSAQGFAEFFVPPGSSLDDKGTGMRLDLTNTVTPEGST